MSATKTLPSIPAIRRPPDTVGGGAGDGHRRRANWLLILEEFSRKPVIRLSDTFYRLNLSWEDNRLFSAQPYSHVMEMSFEKIGLPQVKTENNKGGWGYEGFTIEVKKADI